MIRDGPPEKVPAERSSCGIRELLGNARNVSLTCARSWSGVQWAPVFKRAYGAGESSSARFAAVVGLIGWIQKWQLVPWLPTLGVTVAAVCYLLNDPIWVNLAMLASGLTVIWHSQQRERRHGRDSAPKLPQ